MALKMKQLTKLTNTPKSTILYYIKEGLLPQPKKIKPNVHLYDDDFIERIRFIKYLQSNFNASISQIKQLIDHKDFDFSRGFETLLETIDVVMSPSSDKIYSADEVCQKISTSKEKLEKFLKMGAIFERNEGFSEKELEIISILLELEKVDPHDRLLKTYLKHAKELSSKEIEFADELLKHKSIEERNVVIKSMFDATLILKPYLFNMHLVENYQRKKSEK